MVYDPSRIVTREIDSVITYVANDFETNTVRGNMPLCELFLQDSDAVSECPSL